MPEAPGSDKANSLLLQTNFSDSSPTVLRPMAGQVKMLPLSPAAGVGGIKPEGLCNAHKSIWSGSAKTLGVN